MGRKISFVLIFIWLITIYVTSAQETSSLLLLPGTYQSSFFNPAYQNKSNKLAIGIPFLSGVYADWKINVPINSLFYNGFNYDLGNFYNALDDYGKLEAAVSLSMFFASMKYNDYTFSLSVSERAFVNGSFDKEMIRIIKDGTQNFYGNDENFGVASIHLQHFRQISLGTSKQTGEKLDLGIRGKILFGKLYFDTKDINLSVETDETNNVLLVSPDGSCTFSGPFRHTRDTIFNFSTFSVDISPGDYFFQPRNLGLAFDAGLIFRPDKLTEFSLSLIDFGFTGFKYNLYDINFKRPVRYPEESLYQSHTPEAEDYIEPREALKDFSDSLSYIINVTDSPYRHIGYLPFKINSLIKYRFSEKLSSGIASLLTGHKSYLSSLLSVFAHTYPFNKVELAGNISFYNFSQVMPGLGITYTGKKAQFFLSSNNILGIIEPATSKHLNLCFGINFLFETE